MKDVFKLPSYTVNSAYKHTIFDQQFGTHCYLFINFKIDFTKFYAYFIIIWIYNKFTFFWINANFITKSSKIIILH